MLISVVYLFAVAYANKTVYTARFNPIKTKQLYDQSQWQQSQNISPIKTLDTWALEHHYTGWKNYVDENKEKLDTEKVKAGIIQSVRSKGISDTELYAYAGYEYVHGTDPTLLNPEHPPLGKYLIGLSIQLFQNENVILLLCGIVSLVLVFEIVRRDTPSPLFAAIAVFLTATQTLFTDQLIHGPQLELFQLMFFLAMLFSLQLYDKTKIYTYLITASIAFGLLLSIKTVSTHFPLFFALFTLLLITRHLKIGEFVTIHLVGLLTFVLTYASFFLHGNSLRKWLGVQKYIVIFYRQSGINIIAFAGNYLRLIFTGTWKFWSDNTPISRYGGWSIMWIIVFIAGVLSLIKRFRAKQKSLLEVTLFFFVILYNCFLFIVPMFPRYLLLLFVPMILYMCITGSHLLSYEKKKL